MPDDLSNSIEMELSRVRHAFWLAVIGLFLAAALAIFLVIKGEAKMNTSAEVVAIVGLFTSVTGHSRRSCCTILTPRITLAFRPRRQKQRRAADA